MPRLRFSIIAVASLFLANTANGNGRPFQTVDVFTQPGNEQLIVLSATFGQLISRDGGSTFQWLCEDAVGYEGVFDPDFVITAEGDMLAGTDESLQISRDGGCTWEAAAGELGRHWIDDLEMSPAGEIWAITSTTGRANDVFLSADDGETFVSKNMLHETAFWKSIRIAPSNDQRIYLTGYTVAETQGDAGPSGPAPLFYRSDDKGETWNEIEPEGIEYSRLPLLRVLAVAPDDPDVVFARSVRANGSEGDVLYRSVDAGQTWTEAHRTATPLRGFLIRQNGQIMVGTTNDGQSDRVFVSTDDGVTFAPAPSQPQMACLAELPNGDLLACGANWEPDFFALGRSSDGIEWSKLVRFSEIDSAYQCPAQTIQASVCEAKQWPSLCTQFGCNNLVPDAGQPRGDGGGGCCDASAGPAGAMFLAGLTGFLLMAVALRKRRLVSRD